MTHNDVASMSTVEFIQYLLNQPGTVKGALTVQDLKLLMDKSYSEGYHQGVLSVTYYMTGQQEGMLLN